MAYTNTYLQLIGEAKGYPPRFKEYKCICGTILVLPYKKVDSFHTKSCGCMTKKLVSINKSKHSLSKHPLFKVWANIIARCYSPYSSKYPYYGAKGVRVCDDWRNNFKSFFDWAISNGWEKGKQIDKDIIPRKIGIPSLLYSPELCKIVTNKENANCRKTNKVYEYKGERKSISQWADFVGIDQRLMRYRINKWGIEKAIKKPLGNGTSVRIICETTGEIFESIILAGKKNNISKKIMYNILNGQKESYNGLVFKYLN